MIKLQQGLDDLGWRTFKGCQEHEVKEFWCILMHVFGEEWKVQLTKMQHHSLHFERQCIES